MFSCLVTHSWSCFGSIVYVHQTREWSFPINGEKRRLVTVEPVEFEK
jgi:hypothetical protein